MGRETEIVKKYYDDNTQKEWDRLTRHRAEFEITKRFMHRYIKPGDRIADIGGGPGRYSLYWAGLGCDVTLLDLSEENTRFAQKKAKEVGLPLRVITGDARKADRLVSGLFDHVFLMGPLYHLLSETDRIATVEAALNLLKPGGILYAAFISSYAGVLYCLAYQPEMLLDPLSIPEFNAFINNQSFTGPSFTQAYYTRQEDVLPFMNRFPVKKLHFLSAEGLMMPREQELAQQPEHVFQTWIDLSEKVCERENLLGFANHFLYIGEKYDI